MYESRPLPGHPDVLRLTCATGDFVIKKPWDPLDVELYSRVEVRLNDLGIRQARQLRTSAGALLASTGHAVQEFLSGEVLADHPGPALTRRFLTHLAEYDSALAGLAVPAELAARDSVWTRVVRPGYLIAELPGLLARQPQLGLDRAPIDRLLGVLSDGPDRLTSTAGRQLVHGDLGPDNVLADRAGLVIIDFTPYHDSVLLGLGSAVYFFQLHGQDPTRADLEASFASYGADPAAGWATLAREALRRLATPFAAAAERGTGLDETAARRRHRAVATLATLIP
ncbi:phosphotransferase [Microlunatus parietis]|uniref:Aminoglycoside phosphotransferase domain-containing protein n=1 Tax=Microlunatus parietis TaxID=682979 RepID=A0A7Y9LDU2_9ACTN|nr:phosphotransferase [Microlunatus parietis]NYE73213.1 hypothetical protein [Microlunatus parietis]